MILFRGPSDLTPFIKKDEDADERTGCDRIGHTTHSLRAGPRLMR